VKYQPVLFYLAFASSPLLIYRNSIFVIGKVFFRYAIHGMKTKGRVGNARNEYDVIHPDNSE